MPDDRSPLRPAEPSAPPAHRRPAWLRFSLRSLLLATLLVAVFLAGRLSTQDAFGPPIAGTWTAVLPSGFRQPTRLQFLEGDQWLLSSSANVFNGVYRYRDGKLTVVKPADARMTGLIWKWDGKQLTLIAEPAGTPTGSSYLGTVLQPAKSAALQQGASRSGVVPAK